MRSLLAPSLAVAATLSLALPASAHTGSVVPTADVTGGSTRFVLTDEAVKTLAEHQVKLEAVAPATAVPGARPGVEVTVSAGEVVPVPFSGSLTYAGGGFRFVRDADHAISFVQGQADLTKGVSTAVAQESGGTDNRARIPFATYKIDPANVKPLPSGTEVTISGADIALTSEAAVAVNKALDAKVFDAGDIVFEYASTLKLGGALPAAGLPL